MALTITSETINGSGENREVIYRVTDSLGPDFDYRMGRVPGAFDVVAYRARLVTKLEEAQKEQEVEEWLQETGTPPPLVYAVRPRYLSTWRATFKDSRREEALRLAYHMKTAIDRGDFTDAQMQTAWSMTNPELTQFNSRLETRRLVYVDILNEVAE